MKNKPFLICVDSDGCAMNSMTVKHTRAFGPCLVKQWGLHQHEDEILKEWNRVNLYTATRGVHRFEGLARVLRYVDQNFIPIEGLDDLERWVAQSKELSEPALVEQISRAGSACLKKAYLWSREVNQTIAQMPPQTVLPFPGVEDALRRMAEVADVAIVSSANREAVIEEWERFSLMHYVTYVMAQDAGRKADCIAQLLNKGYRSDKTLMCGDALGDEQAAEKNGVWFFPIVPTREPESWAELTHTGIDRLLSGRYANYEGPRKRMFHKNLGMEE